LQHAQQRFREHGIGLVAVSYDSQAILKDFSTRQGITFPLLADTKSELIQRFGVLNTTATGFTKGMAYPGFIYIGPDKQIRETFFEKQYGARYTANNVLTKLFPELAEFDLRTLAADHLQLQLGQSATQDACVRPVSARLQTNFAGYEANRRGQFTLAAISGVESTVSSGDPRASTRLRGQV
jgi:hypothetical protein